MTQTTNLVGPRSGRQRMLERVLSNPLFPPPPALALRVVERASDPDCSAREVANILASDPGLCGKLLKIVNSALFSPTRPVTGITQAVTLLGLERLRSLVLGVALPALRLPDDPDDGLRRFWKASVGGAIIARELAIRAHRPNPEDDLAAALMRELGAMLLWQTFPDAYRPLWSGEQSCRHSERCAWEELHVGLNHCEVSAELLRSWRLPGAITEAVRHHHEPEGADSLTAEVKRRARLLNLAGRLAELEDGPTIPEDFDFIWRVAAEEHGLSPEGLEEFLAGVVPRIEQFAALLQVPITSSPRLTTLLAAGSAALRTLPGVQSDHSGSNGRGSAPRGVIRGDDPFGERTQIHLPNFEIRRRIGKGAWGIVYDAIDLTLGRRVALKTLAPERIGCPQAHAMLVREARTAASVRHENVVTVFAAGEADGIPYLAMEFVEGRTLQEELDAGRRFTLADVARIGREVASALAAAHALGVVHRDMKPANVLLEAETERARVTDFGIARGVESTGKTFAGTVIGTPAYMSPEQAEGQTVGPESDMFSFGSLLYALCTGYTPFEGHSAVITVQLVITARPTPVSKRNPDIPPALADLIDRLHSHSPAQRPTAPEVVDILTQMSATL